MLRAAYEAAMKMATAPRVESEPVAIEPAAPPPMVAMNFGVGEYQALCQTLERLVATRGESGEMTAALDAIFGSPVFQVMDVQARTEIWLLRLIAFNTPRSDPLLTQSIAKFGWSDGAGSREIAQLTRFVFRRARDLAAREKMAQPDGDFHPGYAALTKPFERPGFLARLIIPGPYWEVRQCLNHIRAEYPTLMHDLDKQSLAAWQAELAKIRLSPVGWLALLASPAAILVYVLAAPNVLPVNIQFLNLLLLPLPVAVGALLYLAGWQISRRRWRDRWRLACPFWVSWGWAPALLLILMFSAVMPPSAAGSALVLGLGVLAAAWALVTGEPHPRLKRPKAAIALAVLHAPAIMLCLCAGQVLSNERFVAFLGVGIVAILAFGAGNGVLMRQWLSTPRVVKQRLALGASAAVVCAGALVWQSILDQALVPLAIAAALCTELITIVPSYELLPWVLKLRLRVSLPVVIVGAALLTNGVVLDPDLCVFLLVWSACTCGFQILGGATALTPPLRR